MKAFSHQHRKASKKITAGDYHIEIFFNLVQSQNILKSFLRSMILRQNMFLIPDNFLPIILKALKNKDR